MYNMLPSLFVITLPFMFMNSPSMIFLWIILEVSSIMFICMSLSEEEMKKKECFLIYFLIQSFASGFLLVSLFSWMFTTKNMMLENPNNTNVVIILLIVLKVAMGPLHFWLVKISKFISWSVMGVLLTWQKIIPLTFLSTFSMNLSISLICVFSLMVGTLSQLKVTSLKLLMVFSSISQLGWMVFPITKSSMMVMTYLLTYSLIIMPMMILFFYSNYEYLFNQMNYKVIIYLSVMVLSLSGIPPLMGFILKWMCLTVMIPSTNLMILFLSMACLSFYIYIRMIYKSLLLTPHMFNQTTITMNMKSIWVLNFLLPIISFTW